MATVRNYRDSAQQMRVEATYRLMLENQTCEHVAAMKERFGRFDRVRDVWDVVRELDTIMLGGANQSYSLTIFKHSPCASGHTLRSSRGHVYDLRNMENPLVHAMPPQAERDVQYIRKYMKMFDT